MSNVVTIFDTTKHHIYVEFYVTDPNGVPRTAVGVLDTGAPRTEFSDRFLDYGNFIDISKQIQIKPKLQTQKHAKIIISELEIFTHKIKNMEVFISSFDSSWGIDALIGLDFFRQFKVTIDYKEGVIVSEAY